MPKVDVSYHGEGEDAKTNRKRKLYNKAKIINPEIDPEDVPLPEEMELTPRQIKFARNYILDYNGTQAMLRTCENQIVPTSAAKSAYLALRDPKVLRLIQAYEKSISTKYLNTKEKVIKELSISAFSDIADFLDTDARGNTTIKPLEDLGPDITRAIKKLIVNKRTDKEGETHETITFELYDKNSALVTLAKDLGMLRDKVELTGPDGKPLVPEATTLNVSFVKGEKSERV